MTDRRAAIVEATITEIATGGIAGLRLEEVAGSAAVAISLIYYHFQSREGLIDAVLQRANALLKEKLLVIERMPVRGRQRVEMLLLSELDLVDSDRSRAALAWSEVAAAAAFNPRLRAPVAEATNEWIDIIANAIDVGRNDRSIRLDIDAVSAAQRLTATVSGLVTRWQSGVHTESEVQHLMVAAIANEIGAVLSD